MNPVFPKLARGLLLAGVTLAALASADAQQPARRQATGIEFTEPGAAGTGTNAAETSSTNEIIPKKPAFNVLDHTVRKPFDPFNTDDSFSGASELPTRPGRSSTLNSKRARDLLDRKKNWVFNTPEDIYGLPTPEQGMNVPEYGPDGEEKKPKTSLERYFERMEKSRADTATNRVKDSSLPDWLKPDDKEERLSSADDDKAGDHSFFGTGKANSKRNSANAEFTAGLGGESSTTEKNHNEFFSLGSSDSSTKPVGPDPAVARRMEAFTQLLVTGSPVSPVSSGLGAGFGLASPSSPGGSALQSPFSAGMLGRDSFGSQPASRPSSLPSVSSATTLPGGYAPAFTAPPAAPVSRTFTPPVSGFELPKRIY